MLLADQPTVGLCKPERWASPEPVVPAEQLAIDGFDGRVLAAPGALGKQPGQRCFGLKDTIEEAFLEY